MAVGPVQLVVLGFAEPEFKGEVVAELQRLRESDTVRVIDALAVYKRADGEIEQKTFSNLTEDETVELGAVVGALIGYGMAGEEGAAAGALAGADEAAESGIDPLPNELDWDVLDDIPPNTAAALILLEHQWAVPLRDAIASANGFRIADGFISPLDLVAVGLIAAEEAKQLEELEQRGATVAS